MKHFIRHHFETEVELIQEMTNRRKFVLLPGDGHIRKVNLTAGCLSKELFDARRILNFT